MTRKDFTNILLENKIESVTIVRYPKCGGHAYEALLNHSEEEVDDYLRRHDFHYHEWSGDASKAASHHGMAFMSVYELPYEEPKEYLQYLDDLVVEAIGRLHESYEAQAGTLEPAC